MDTRNGSSDEESEGEHNGRSKKARAEAVQTQRQAEVREKEKERDRARADAAGRRQERAGRRRVEDELVEDTPRATTSAKTSAPPSSQPASPPVHLVPEKLSHKKGAGKKTKKLGNNQYTKLREQGGVPSSPHSKKRQLASHGTVSSGDEQLPNGETNTSNSTNKNSPDHTSGGPVSKGPGRFGKNKKNGLNGNGAKGANGDGNGGERTMASMNRTLEAMSRSIAAAQLELAGSGVGGAVREPGGGGGDRPFEELSAMEMADVVSRGIYEWQTRWAHMV